MIVNDDSAAMKLKLAKKHFLINFSRLKPIPEGYEPKEWEYERHPITRFFKQYVFHTDQENYEFMAHQVYFDVSVSRSLFERVCFGQTIIYGRYISNPLG